jgi:hypothetical protein
MAEKRSIGLTSLKMGAIAVDGDMGTTLAAVGVTYKDSCELMQDDANVTDIECEETDDPVESIEILGKRTLKWSIMDYSPDTLVKVLGGTVTGAGTELDPKVWNAPSTSPAIEQSIELVSKSGVKFEIPRAKVMAKLNAKIVKNGVALVDITANILTPTKAGVAAIMITEE